MSKPTTEHGTEHAKRGGRSGKPRGTVDLRTAVEAALRKAFPTDTVDISDGFNGNLHVLVVSRRFDTMNERSRIKFLEEVIVDAGLTKAQQAKISLLLALSPGEIK
jgi:hypothetical protein